MPKGPGLDRAVRFEFPGEKLDVDAGTAVDVGRKFIGEEGDFHGIKSMLI